MSHDPGNNPNEAIRFWELMAANSTGKTSELLSTHPLEQKRIQDFKNFLPEAMKYYSGK